MAVFRIGTPTSQTPTSVGARIIASLFYLVFAAMGLVVTGFFFVAMKNGMVSWGWKPAQCRVLATHVDELLFTLPPEKAAVESHPYQLAVTYQWERDGRVFNGTHVGGTSQFATRAKAEAALARYPADATVSCYVNPRDPNEASLRRPRLWPLLVLGFPLLFVGFGVAGIVATWRGGWRRRPSSDLAPPRSRRAAKGGRGCAAAAFSLFAIFGGGFLLFFVVPAMRALVSRGWELVPATIVWSGVGEHSGDDSTTYSVDVLYEYEHGGRKWRSNRYHFMSGSSSGEESKQEVVARLPPGARVDAWVDPRDPSNAVLDRSLGSMMWFALLPLIFVVVGVGGMVAMLRAGGGGGAVPFVRGKRGRAPTAPAGSDGQAEAAAGPILLQPAKSRVGSFIALFLFTLVWDGVVGFAIWATMRDGKFGHDGCVTVFLGVFGLIGLLLLSALPRTFLALFNPRAEVQISSPPAPGVPVALSWRFLGSAGRLRRLTIKLEGREEATYRRGTDTTTVKRTFARYVLVDARDASQIAAGETLLALPADTMHTFEAPHNKVVWSLKLHGDIPSWPDVDDEVALTVYPTSLAGGEVKS
ncbi:MAG TPA: DUF3592 domain-containing protein [Thermoanaerobaculia bacterium]|nr:DUF3592 domain-containing protein [Thermoanaerobaculia bacterium]